MKKIEKIEDCFREILGTISIEELISNNLLVERAKQAETSIKRFKKEL